MIRLFCVASLLVLPGAVGGAADPAAPDDHALVPVDKLVEVFQTNEVRAAALFVDKEFDLSGRVSRVITSRYGSPGRDRSKDSYVVELQTKPLDISRISVQCFFDETERDRLAEIKAGQDIVIRGMCGNRVLYTGEYKRGEKDYTEVPFRNCRIVRPGQSAQ